MSISDQQPGQPVRRGVVAVIVREGRLLVIRRSQAVIAPGAYCFPGGGIEAGENEPQALCRELVEELGICVAAIRPLWECTTPWNVELTWWLASCAIDCVIVPNPAEVESVHWLLPNEIRALPELLSSNQGFLDALDAGQIELPP